MYLRREKEENFIRAKLSQKSSVSLVYGRRFVGKSELAMHLSKNHTNALYCSVTPMSEKLLLHTLFQKVCEFFQLQDTKPSPFETLSDFFDFLFEYTHSTEPLLVVLDDIHLLSKHDKNIFNHFFEIYHNNNQTSKVHFIFTSNIALDKQIKKKYHSYISDALVLDSLPFEVYDSLFENMPKSDKLLLYSIYGTNPRYLRYYKKELEALQNIFTISFAKNSLFFEEGLDILRSEIVDLSLYASILYAIALGNQKLGDIANFLEEKSTHLTRYLTKLSQMFLVKKTVPLGQSQLKSKYGRYCITDPYLRFWFIYIYPNKDALQFGPARSIVKNFQESLIPNLLESAYKEYIYKKIKNHSKKILGFEAKQVQSWWDNKDEIDIIASNYTQIVYIKIFWQEKQAANIEFAKLKILCENFQTSKKKSYLIITRNSFLENKI